MHRGASLIASFDRDFDTHDTRASAEVSDVKTLDENFVGQSGCGIQMTPDKKTPLLYASFDLSLDEETEHSKRGLLSETLPLCCLTADRQK